MTIREVARLAGVSPTTVSRVLNKRTEYAMRPETRDRILRIIKELDYKPDNRARSLRTAKRGIIGLVVPNILNPFCAQLAVAIEDACYQRGYGLIFCHSKHDRNREISYVDLLEREKVDGIILVTTGLDKAEVSRVSEKRIRIVLTDEDVPGLSVPGVFVNNYKGECEALEYLISLGHRRIALITGPMALFCSKERIRGYIDTLKKWKLEIDKKLIAASDYTYEGGYEVTERLLNQFADKFTAIACLNDLMALGAISAIQDKGLNVPMDYSIIGFDNIYVASISNPPLTTIAQPVEALSRKILEIFDILVQNNSTKDEKNKRYFFDPKLVIRES